MRRATLVGLLPVLFSCGSEVQLPDASSGADALVRADAGAMASADAAPEGDATELADASPGADAATGADAGSALVSSCDPPVVIDDSSPGADRWGVSFFQAPGAPTLITWLSGTSVLGRFLEGTTLSATVSLAERPAQIDPINPNFAAVSARGAAFVGSNQPNGHVRYFDHASKSWSATEIRRGLHGSAVALTSDGSALHTTADFSSSRVGLVARSPEGTFGAEHPLDAFGGDRAQSRRIFLDESDRGAVVLLAGGALHAYPIVGTATIGPKAVMMPLPGGNIASEFLSHRGPDGSVVVIWQENAASGGVTRAATYTNDRRAGTWSAAETVGMGGARLFGIFVDDRGDVTYTYGQGASWWARRRVAGQWGTPKDLGPGGLWFTNVVGRAATGEVFIVNTDADQGTRIDLYAIGRGDADWTGPIQVDRAAQPTWTLPQRPRLGLDDDGHLLVAWSAHKDAGPNEIVMATCR